MVRKIWTVCPDAGVLRLSSVSERRIGYRLAETSYAVPSILAYTEAEWNHRKQSKSPFFETVEREAVRVM